MEENHSSANLIQLDENLLEFDPLAQHVPKQPDQMASKKISQDFTSYSDELLGLDSSSKDSGIASGASEQALEGQATSNTSNALEVMKQSFNSDISQSNPLLPGNLASYGNNVKPPVTHSKSTGMPSAFSSHTQNKPNAKSGTFTSYVSNSKIVKAQQKSQSKFYGASQESKTRKKSQSLFHSYLQVNDQHGGSTTSITSGKGLQDGITSSSNSSPQSEKEELLAVLMMKRQEDFTSKRSFRIFVGTWNVNGRAPPADVNLWTAVDPNPPDIYVIGFQELDLSKEAFVFAESSREEEWLQVVCNSLHPKATYTLVKLIRLVGMMLLVFTAKQHTSHIQHVQTHQVGTGLLGKMGNKGGVGVRFNLHSTTICVVNSHLAAHAEMTQKRNEDYTDICSRMHFLAPNKQEHVSIFQHDVLFWLGDLNYRIEGMLPGMVKECIKINHFRPLRDSDQLLRQQKAGKAFHNFEEGELKFHPTYKYDPGTDSWDSSEKCRAPAWCDRILWREGMPRNLSKKNPVKSVSLLVYRSHPGLRISDHKPVSALFDVKIKVIDQNLYKKVFNEEVRHLDQLENERLPTMTLSSHSIDFGSVHFQESVVRSVELQNTGLGVCHFEFIAKPGASGYCKRWLDIPKSKGYMLPGEKLEIHFEVYVNKSTVGDLNSGKEKLEDILILHLVGGKDFFITVSGIFVPTCFGMSIECLCRLRKPIRETSQSDILAMSKISPMGSGNLLIDISSSPIPKELWQLVDHLYKNALHEPSIFQTRGLHISLHEIQEVLDTTLPPVNGSRTLPGSNHSVAEAMLVFLESLPEPIIPFHLYHQCIESYNDIVRSKQLLKSLSFCHLNVFNYLISFLQKLLTHQIDNKVSVPMLGSIFSNFFLRPEHPKHGIENRIERQKAKTFIENFLVTPLEDLVSK